MGGGTGKEIVGEDNEPQSHKVTKSEETIMKRVSAFLLLLATVLILAVGIALPLGKITNRAEARVRNAWRK